MKQIKKELTFKLQDTNNTLDHYSIYSPELLLSTNILYNNITNYNSGKITLTYPQDSTTIYTLTQSSSIIFIESSHLINIYINDSTSPIITRTFSYDNPNYPIQLCLTLAAPSQSISDYYELEPTTVINYITGDYEEVLF